MVSFIYYITLSILLTEKLTYIYIYAKVHFALAKGELGGAAAFSHKTKIKGKYYPDTHLPPGYPDYIIYPETFKFTRTT